MTKTKALIAIVLMFTAAIAFLYQRQSKNDADIAFLKASQDDRQLADYLACTAGTLCDHLYPVQAAKIKAANDAQKNQK